ncbi:MAG: ParA family protein, partial [Butyrivibrio sp.]|nr:ParA family protein [Butyrivibrio sp.]
SEVMEEKKLSLTETIIRHDEGVDLIPANIELSALEISLVNAMSREVIALGLAAQAKLGDIE